MAPNSFSSEAGPSGTCPKSSSMNKFEGKKSLIEKEKQKKALKIVKNKRFK